MPDEDLDKKIDELDEQFKKWEAGSKEHDAKLVEKEYPGPPDTRPSRREIEIDEDDLKKLPELEEMADSDVIHDLDKDLIISYPHPRSHPRSRLTRHETENLRYRKKQQRKEKILATLAIGVLIPVILVAMCYIPYPGPPMPYQPHEFSVTISDGLSGDELDEYYFGYKLYGVNDDPCDFSGFVLLETSEGIHHLKYFDFDDYGYEFYFIEYNGTNEEGNKIYYTRWAQIRPDTSNDLVTFALPSSSGMSILFMNLTSVDPAKGTGENITIIVGANKSEPGCGYVPTFDYSREEETNIEIKIVFRNAIGITDFRVKNNNNYNMQRYKINSTCMAFIIHDLLATLTTYYGYWYVSGNSIINMQLTWGMTTLCWW
jgi:hypothetical protein